MPFNFPASPSNGQTYTPVGGPVFTWDGTAWKALSQGMPVTVFVGDVAPTAPAFGNLWWESDTGNLYIYYNDGDSAQWVQINGTPAGYQTADSRNRIVNGAMQISQENGDTGSTTAGAYPVDQFVFYHTGLGTVSAARQATTNLSPNRTSTLMTWNTTAKPSLAATDYWFLRQAIEGIRVKDFAWGTPQARQAVLRFWAWCQAGGTYNVALKNVAGDRVFLATYTLAASTWKEISIVIPGDTGGTWLTDTGVGLYVNFYLAMGSNSVGGAVGWNALSGINAPPGCTNGAATANIFLFGDVGLYLDPDNTGVAPKWQMPDEAEELRACQRYWQKSQQFGGMFSGGVVATATYSCSYVLPVPMRVKPDVTGVNNNNTPPFPATVGSLTAGTGSAQNSVAVAETRTASTTSNNGLFHSIVTASARM